MRDVLVRIKIKIKNEWLLKSVLNYFILFNKTSSALVSLYIKELRLSSVESKLLLSILEFISNPKLTFYKKSVMQLLVI